MCPNATRACPVTPPPSTQALSPASRARAPAQSATATVVTEHGERGRGLGRTQCHGGRCSLHTRLSHRDAPKNQETLSLPIPPLLLGIPAREVDLLERRREARNDQTACGERSNNRPPGSAPGLLPLQRILARAPPPDHAEEPAASRGINGLAMMEGRVSHNNGLGQKDPRAAPPLRHPSPPSVMPQERGAEP